MLSKTQAPIVAWANIALLLACSMPLLEAPAALAQVGPPKSILNSRRSDKQAPPEATVKLLPLSGARMDKVKDKPATFLQSSVELDAHLNFGAILFKTAADLPKGFGVNTIPVLPPESTAIGASSLNPGNRNDPLEGKEQNDASVLREQTSEVPDVANIRSTFLPVLTNQTTSQILWGHHTQSFYSPGYTSTQVTTSTTTQDITTVTQTITKNKTHARRSHKDVFSKLGKMIDHVGGATEEGLLAFSGRMDKMQSALITYADKIESKYESERLKKRSMKAKKKVHEQFTEITTRRIWHPGALVETEDNCRTATIATEPIIQSTPGLNLSLQAPISAAPETPNMQSAKLVEPVPEENIKALSAVPNKLIARSVAWQSWYCALVESIRDCWAATETQAGKVDLLVTVRRDGRIASEIVPVRLRSDPFANNGTPMLARAIQSIDSLAQTEVSKFPEPSKRTSVTIELELVSDVATIPPLTIKCRPDVEIIDVRSSKGRG